MKQYKWMIILLIFLSVVGGGVWYYYRDYSVFTDAEKVGDYPSLPWQAVVDGSVSRSLARQAGQGKLRDFGPEVAPVTRFVRLPGEYVENNGVDLVELPSEIVHSPQYLDTAKRPFVIVAYFQTMIEGEKHYLIYQRWRSVDGSESYVPLILPEAKVVEGGAPTKYYLDLTSNDANHMLSPIMHLATRDFCVSNMAGQAGYCNWLFESEGRRTKYEEILSNWVESAVVPREMGRYPAPVRITPLAWGTE